MINYEFEKLTLSERADILWAQGVHIESIIYYGCQSLLYLLEKEFVEVRLNPITNQIETIEMISGQDLDKFINRVDLSSLQQNN